MANPVLDFYESLAAHYHLIFEDWDRSMHRQAKALNSILLQQAPDRPLNILDCACGIGTQAMGFAAIGHRVTGSDLSPANISRARTEAHLRHLDIEFHVADMTDLSQFPASHYDVVAALDNALPHLASDQLAQAAGQLASRLCSGGLFLASIRDYDALLQQKPTMLPPSFWGAAGTRRIVHQVWDWTGPASYDVHLYITIETAARWETHHFVSKYRCLKRQELSEVLLSAGFHQPIWLSPEESGYYQPLLLARWP